MHETYSHYFIEILSDSFDVKSHRNEFWYFIVSVFCVAQVSERQKEMENVTITNAQCKLMDQITWRFKYTKYQ